METIARVISEIEGSYALGIIFSDFQDKVFAVRKDSPLIIGVGQGENFIASDVTAVLKYTKDYYLLEQDEIVAISTEQVEITDIHGCRIEKELQHATWDEEAAEKGGYEHFMLKEIHEQPTALKTTITPRIMEHMPFLLSLIHI